VLSFDYDNDARQKDLLVGQSKHPDTDFEFADWSSKEHLTGDWKAKIKAKMAHVDVVCVLCGKSMITATGVSHEVQMAQALGKPYFLLAAYPDGSTKPAGAYSSDQLYKWTWENLKALIRGGANVRAAGSKGAIIQ
ncbi:TIR domain-containing protein, partial [Xanthomonas vasicola]|uniref:TIR domain-containing protein n=1 Tax=Xanthomonas vasicola TaxID=56459 RepID=UPI0030EBB1F8